MIPENIKILLYQTQKLMYGLNYEVILGIEIFDNCVSITDINRALKETFTNTNPETITPVPISEEDFWEDVTEKFDYRGDNIGTSLKLDGKKETELSSRLY